jgi:spermidine synthase
MYPFSFFWYNTGMSRLPPLLRRAVPAAIVPAAAGFLAVVTQTALLRETLTVFQGNELTIGLSISHWLLGAILGIVIIRKLPANDRLPAGELPGISFPALAAWSLAACFFIRGLRPILHLLPYEYLSLWNVLRSSLIVFLPCGMLSGMQFLLITCRNRRESGTSPAGNEYLFAAAGGCAGGLLFTFTLRPGIPLTASLIVLLAASALLAGFMLQAKVLRRCCHALAAAAALLLPLAGTIDRATLSWPCSSYRIVEHIDSWRNRLTVADRHGERSFFSDGIPLLSFPNQEIVQTEEFGRLPLLFLPRPQRILLIGGGVKYLPLLFARDTVQHITYLEPDPALLPLLQKHLPQNLGSLLKDPRLEIAAVDAREFLARSTAQYDVILIGLPSPITLSLNRFYTREFLTLAQAKLDKEGVLAFPLPGSSVYIDPALWEMNYLLWETAHSIFPHVAILPGDTNIIVASPAPLASPYYLKKRLVRAGNDSLFLSPDYIQNKLNPDRMAWLYGQLSPYKDRRTVNADLAPRGMLASLIYRHSIFASRGTALFRFILRHSWIIVLISLLWLLRNRAGFAGSAVTSGAAAAGLLLLSIWGMQITNGKVYQLLGLLFCSFMAGLAAGGWLGRSPVFLKNGNGGIFFVETLFIVWIAAWGALFHFIPLAPYLFFLLSAGTGTLLGAGFFPLAQASAAAVQDDQKATEKILAAHLLGGWLAALIGGMILLPAWGFERSLAFICLLKLVSMKWRLNTLH